MGKFPDRRNRVRNNSKSYRYYKAVSLQLLNGGIAIFFS
jgi:hypothetical protein